MVDVLEIVSTAMLGGVERAARRVIDVVRRRLGSVTDNPDDLRRAVLDVARYDDDWTVQLVAAVAASNPATARSVRDWASSVSVTGPVIWPSCPVRGSS